MKRLIALTFIVYAMLGFTAAENIDSETFFYSVAEEDGVIEWN